MEKKTDIEQDVIVDRFLTRPWYARPSVTSSFWCAVDGHEGSRRRLQRRDYFRRLFSVARIFRVLLDGTIWSERASQTLPTHEGVLEQMGVCTSATSVMTI